LEKLNATTKVDDFELIIKNIIDDLSESKILEGTLDQKLVAIKQALKEMGTMLKTQVNLVPRIEYTVDSNLNDIIKQFKENNTEMEKIHSIMSINNKQASLLCRCGGTFKIQKFPCGNGKEFHLLSFDCKYPTRT